jgi:protein gp37
VQKTPIEWTDMSWSPVIGCSRISPGCGGASGVGGCYAERLVATRMSKNPKLPMYHGLGRLNENGDPRWSGEVRFLPERLDEPLRKRKPQRIFVCDMSDLFHEKVMDEQIAAVFGVMAAAPQHTFQVLTKRAARLPEWFKWARVVLAEQQREIGAAPNVTRSVIDAAAEYLKAFGDGPLNDAWRAANADPWPLPNVWLGVSVEDRKHGLPRIEELRRTPAAVRFLSIEPLLEDLGEIDLTGVHWVIVGGESGPGARPFDLAWARSIRNQCLAAGVPFFMKQAGGNPRVTVIGKHLDTGEPMTKVLTPIYKDKKGGDLDELPEDLRVREMPVTR